MRNWFLKTVLPWMKKHCWYVVLLIASSCYVFVYRYDIYELSEFNSMYLIFALWLVLLGLPLFSEIEIGSIKLKKELENTRTEIKEEVRNLRNDIKVSVALNYGPMPSDADMEKQKEHANSEKSADIHSDADYGVSEAQLYLAKVRMSLEKQMATLCEKNQLDVRSRTLGEMARLLTNVEAIDNETAKLIRQVTAIVNRSAHGEIVDKNYVEFVENAYPTIKRSLKTAQESTAVTLEWCVCPKCRYQGRSKWSNVCPDCGCIFCDD